MCICNVFITYIVVDGCVSDTPKLECKHIYEIGPHKVCTKCGYCTGFGPGCTNSHLDNRAPGMLVSPNLY